jgi:hypothetical protein
MISRHGIPWEFVAFVNKSVYSNIIFVRLPTQFLQKVDGSECFKTHSVNCDSVLLKRPTAFSHFSLKQNNGIFLNAHIHIRLEGADIENDRIGSDGISLFLQTAAKRTEKTNRLCCLNL